MTFSPNLCTSDAGDTGLKLPSSLDVTSTLEFKDSADSAYEKLTSPDFLYSMARGHIRVKRLLSKNVTGLNEKFKDLVPCFGDFFTSVEILRVNDNAAERARLVSLAKRILEGWKNIENEIGQPQQPLVSGFDLAPSDYPHVVPSAWLFEYDWRDKAYEEVLSLKKYSYLLDQAYIDICRDYKMNKVSGLTTLPYKKLLNFLASSKEDIGYLSGEKCYKRVMNIKRLFTCRDQCLDLGSLRAPWSYSTDQTQPPNWRDKIYDQILASRKMYSLELDEDLRVEFDGMKSETLDKNVKARHSFTEQSLQFLAIRRADLVFRTEEYCLQQLAGIKLFMEGSQESPSTSLVNGVTNWRDLAYEQLQNKADRFRYQVYDVYQTYKAIWSQIPELEKQFKKHEEHLQRALEFYEMRRARMSSLDSADDYFRLSYGITGDVGESIRLIKDMLCSLEEDGTEPSWGCSPGILIPKRSKLLPLFCNV